MSGFLDSKQRVMDVIMTNEGRKQLASGRLRVTYASFSDASSCYEHDPVSGSSDIGDRIYLEAGSLPQDSIAIEADDSGMLMPFGIEGDILLRGGQLFRDVLTPATGTLISGSNRGLEPVSGSTFVSQVTDILSGSIDNLNRLRILSTWNPDVEDLGFAVGPTNVEFQLNDAKPISDRRLWTRSVSSMDSIFNDPRLSQLPNFRYLPPINRIHGDGIDRTIEANVKGERIADYPAWGTVVSPDEALRSLLRELDVYEKVGFCRRISIEPTSRENNLMCQLFEVGDRTVRKLDVIHFGRFNTNERSSPVIDVFFAGRVLVDDNGTSTFIHLFTLVFD